MIIHKYNIGNNVFTILSANNVQLRCWGFELHRGLDLPWPIIRPGFNQHHRHGLSIQGLEIFKGPLLSNRGSGDDTASDVRCRLVSWYLQLMFWIHQEKNGYVYMVPNKIIEIQKDVNYCNLVTGRIMHCSHAKSNCGNVSIAILSPFQVKSNYGNGPTPNSTLTWKKTIMEI